MIHRLASLTAAALFAAVSLASAGSVSGIVTLTGKAPAPAIIKVNSQKFCVPFHPDGLKGESIVASVAGGLKNVVVHIKGATGGTAKTAPMVIAQKGCQYIPHVVALQVGEPLRVTNEDDTLHNIHGRPTANKPFNFGQPKAGLTKDVMFDKEEFIPVKCDVHGWMSSYIAVFADPYFAVTGDDGSFKIDGLPAGTYEIEAWQEKLKTVSAKVTVAAGDAKVNLSFAAK